MLFLSQIWIAYIIDLFIGDPLPRFHPVVLIGHLASFIEEKLNKNSLFLGLLSFIITLAIPLSIYFAISYNLSELSQTLFDTFIIYSLLATHSLYVHAKDVFLALKQKDLIESRRMISKIVGRDTHNLSEKEIIRATLETVSENLSDGVIAPLFYAFIFGAPGILAYKIVNTLDSMWGYRNDRFEKFGKMAAKTDDLLNYIPARITALLILAVAPLIGLNSIRGLKILIRDGSKHSSPNAGKPEAALAGILGVRLGGDNSYQGIIRKSEYLGDPIKELELKDIRKALNMIILVSVLGLIFGSVVLIF